MRYFRKSNSTAFICMRYFIYFSYDGTNYHGWQIQPNAVSVQKKLNWALSTILRSEIETIGAGRTDTGVHASTMVAHFDFLEIENLQNLSANEKTGQEGKHESRIDDIGFLAGYGHI